jgi:hypothetical protein
MTGEDGTRQEPEESYYIPPQTAPGKKDPGPADRKKAINEWLGLACIIIGIFILIAAFQLYFTIQELIRTWISDQFVPVVSALYYIAIIVIGIWLIRGYIRRQ